MKLFKRLLSMALSLALTTQLSFAVFAESKGNTEDVKEVNTLSADDDLPPEKNDPSYWKHIRQMQTVSTYSNVVAAAAYGSANLIHNSRYDGLERVYFIDVSTFQPNINWTKVKQSGINSVIIRLGYRGYGNGRLVIDDKFYSYINGAKSAGLDVGVYFFTQALNTTEAKEEARFCVNALSGYSLSLPIYYDIEGIDYDSGRMDTAGLTIAQRTANCRAFCDTIKSYGFESGVYANRNWLYNMIDGESLGKSYSIWLAEYGTKALYANMYDKWQYTSQAKVSGITGYDGVTLTNVDMSVMYVNANSNSKKTVNGIKTDAYTTTSVSLSWDKTAGATGYRVYVKNSKDGYDYKGYTNSTSYTFKGLTQAQAYTFKVKPYFNSDNSLKYSSSVSTLGTASSAYVAGTRAYSSKVRIVDETSNTLTAEWNAPSKGNYNGYEIAYYDSTTKKYNRIALTSSTKYVIKGLSSMTEKKIALRPYYLAGGKRIYGYFCSAVSAMTTPSAITDETVFFRNDTGVIKWKSQGSKVTYDVYEILGSKSVQLESSIKTNYCYVKNMTPESEYKLRIVARTQYNGKTLSSTGKDISFKVQYTAPVKPRAGESYTSNSVSLKWNKAPYATAYRIYIYNTELKKSVYYKTVPSTETSTVIDGLKENSTYLFKMKAVYGSKYSKFTGLFRAYTKPSAPQELKCTAYSSSTSVWSWSANELATGYNVYLYDSNGEQIREVFVSEPNFRFTGLSSKTDYSVSVQSVIDYGTRRFLSDRSSVVYFKTK